MPPVARRLTRHGAMANLQSGRKISGQLGALAQLDHGGAPTVGREGPNG